MLVKALVVVRDGYTQTGTFDPPGGSPYKGVEVKFRPATADQAYEFFDDKRKYPVKARSLVLAHVKEWNVADESGTAAAVTPETAGQLAYTVLDWMVNLIVGYAAAGKDAEDAKN